MEHDESTRHGTHLICTTYSHRDKKRVGKDMLELFPMFFSEDEDRAVWATSQGATIIRATEIVCDPYGPLSPGRAESIYLAFLHKSGKTSWSARAIAGCIATSTSPTVIVALCESMGQEEAALHLATQAVERLAKNWLGIHR